jgi:hypothetical protein
MKVLELSPEHVSEAFLCLAGKKKYSDNLPPELLQLKDEEWGQLASLLMSLEVEQGMSVLH